MPAMLFTDPLWTISQYLLQHAEIYYPLDHGYDNEIDIC